MKDRDFLRSEFSQRCPRSSSRWDDKKGFSMILFASVFSVLSLLTMTQVGRPESVVSGPSAKSNVVVELFTSEGCSSCPPAETLLRELDAAQPHPSAHIIALEFHVDYWDHIGWKDPFSSAAFTERQQQYQSALKQPSMYTPQAIVDGAKAIVGSERDELRAAIEAASKRPRVALQAMRKDKTVFVECDSAAPVSLFLVETERGLSSQVTRGENKGRVLMHGPVVREVKRLASQQSGRVRHQVGLPASPRTLVVLAVNAAQQIVGAVEVK
jgi:hypothetical protein